MKLIDFVHTHNSWYISNLEKLFYFVNKSVDIKNRKLKHPVYGDASIIVMFFN